MTAPSEGVYYIVREPTGWRLAVQLSAPGEDHQHQAMWENDLAPALAGQWAAALRRDAGELEDILKILVFAFPRGRITKVKQAYVVYHGNDLLPSMDVSKKDIEAAFGIAGKSHWKLDDHEQCVRFEKDELRSVLRLAEDWPATEFWE